MSNPSSPTQIGRVLRGNSDVLSFPLLAVVTALILVMLPLAASSASGPGEAARHAERADFKVLIWYRKDDTLGSFKFEIYDVRKGEYTAAVDEWIKNIREKFPAYYVALRDVNLKREKGATEMLKVGKVIDREVAVAAGLAGIFIGPGGSTSRPADFGVFGGPSAGASSRSSEMRRSPSLPGVDRSFLNRPPTLFPVPVPIPNRPR
jgi:hypothetical protein